MKSNISFYSFKDTDNNVTARKFRKDKQSYFQEFQQKRINQRIQQRQAASKKRAISCSVLVRSEQERQLLNFLQLPQLAHSRSKGKARGKAKESPQQAQLAGKTPLQRILNNKDKFMKTYFSRLKDFKKKPQEEIRHIFPQIDYEEWTIHGYLRGDHILLKAEHISGRERLLKYKYSKYIAEIKTSYEEFAKEKFEQCLLAPYN